MIAWRKWQGSLLAAGLCSLFATAGIALRDVGGAVLVVWIPSGVAVAALYTMEEERWPGFLVLLFGTQVLTLGLLGLPWFDAVALGTSTCVQSLLCTGLGIRVLGGRRRLPRTYAHIVGVFAATLIGSAVGAVIAFPFSGEPDLLGFSWWYLANVLGILTGTPLGLFAWQKLGIGPRIVAMRTDRWLFPLLAGLTVLAFACFSFDLPHLMPLLITGMVIVAVRYDEPSPAVVILLYAAVAMVISIGGASPAPFLSSDPARAMLVLQCWLLVMLATALPLAALMMKRDLLEEQLRGGNNALRQNLMIFDLAEQLAGIGRWRYDLVSGMQDWSPRMLDLNGLSPDLAPDPGDIRLALPDGGEELFGHIARQRDARQPYSFDYRIKPDDEAERILRISILNEFDRSGRRIALFAVAMDVTAQVRREEALELARGQAVQLAAEAQKLANTDPLTGLPNRRCSLHRLKMLVRDAHRQGAPLTVVMFDIDNFKHINDGYGHQTGDDVLVRVARLAEMEVRAKDLIGRIGGEEFVWLLPGVSSGQARQRAERLRRAIEGSSGKDGLPQVTASIGLATLKGADDADRILARADAALYEAKAHGRNQVRQAA